MRNPSWPPGEQVFTLCLQMRCGWIIRFSS